jgi:hypothetical protein
VEFARKRGRTPFTVFSGWLLIALLAGACDKSPSEPFARLVEQAESWAATVRYADELRSNGQVPDAYFKDLLKTARQDLETLRPQFESARDIPQDERTAASDLADNLKSLLATDAPDQARISELETRLRNLASKVRGS